MRTKWRKLRTRWRILIIIFAIVVIGMVFFVACGQGSGGSGPSRLYTGTTTP